MLYPGTGRCARLARRDRVPTRAPPDQALPGWTLAVAVRKNAPAGGEFWDFLHCSSHSSLARKPCRKQISSMVASRCPYRLPLAAAISFSTSRSVKCSRGRNSLLERRRGITVRFSLVGETSRSGVLNVISRYSRQWTVGTLPEIRTVRRVKIGGAWLPVNFRQPHAAVANWGPSPARAVTMPVAFHNVAIWLITRDRILARDETARRSVLDFLVTGPERVTSNP